MRRSVAVAVATEPKHILKVGGLYLDLERSALVTVEDHEIRKGHRTGRVIVCAADGRSRIPERWYCREEVLVEAKVLAPDGDEGKVLP